MFDTTSLTIDLRYIPRTDEQLSTRSVSDTVYEDIPQGGGAVDNSGGKTVGGEHGGRDLVECMSLDRTLRELYFHAIEHTFAWVGDH